MIQTQLNSNVLVAGSRTRLDAKFQHEQLAKFIGAGCSVISGLAKGPDTIAVTYARRNNIKVHKYPANWRKYGKSAGYIRNSEMMKVADCCIVFYDGVSNGTKDTIIKAINKGIPVFVHTFEDGWIQMN